MKNLVTSLVIFSIGTSLTTFAGDAQSISFNNKAGSRIEIELCTCLQKDKQCTCKKPLPFITLKSGKRPLTTSADQFKISKINGKEVKDTWHHVQAGQVYTISYNRQKSEICVNASCAKVIK